MTCADVQLRLDDYVDASLSPGDAAAIAAHLPDCPSCSGLAADLSRLRAAAGTLGAIDPPAAIWERIASQPAIAPAARSRRPFMRWIGLAAALAIVTSAAVIVSWRSRPEIAAGNSSAASAVQPIEQKLLEADRLYEEAIAQLEALGTDTTGLDPALARSLDASRVALDRAIAESRAALARDPANEAARASLFQSLRRKVRLLQDTIVVVGDTQGEPPGRKSS
jgi:predicted anti-sigma-YlaC factor YlaD